MQIFHKTIKLTIIIFILYFLNACSSPISIPLKEIGQEVVSYVVSKEVFDPLWKAIFPEKTDEEIKKNKEEIGKLILNDLWKDFGYKCEENENYKDCSQRLKTELSDIIMIYKKGFPKHLKECQKSCIHEQKSQECELIVTYSEIDNCLLKKNPEYKKLIDAINKIKLRRK